MTVPIIRYQSYLLRLWQDNPQAMWHATAQSIKTNEIVHFADLESLYRFLAAQTAPGAPVDQIDEPKNTP